MSVILTIKNLDEIERMFKKAPGKMLDGIHKAIQRSILIIERNAKREAPVNKGTGGGTLRQSIKSKMSGRATGEVSVEAKYAMFVHEGTRPHVIRPTRMKALANTREGKFFGRLVMHPGTQPNPFLERAVKQSEDDINREFDKIILKAFI